MNLLAEAGPVVQAADDDRLRRQVEQRAGAEGGDDLAVADLTVGAGVRPGHHSSSSTSMLSSVLTQRFTPGSTSAEGIQRVWTSRQAQSSSTARVEIPWPTANSQTSRYCRSATRSSQRGRRRGGLFHAD